MVTIYGIPNCDSVKKAIDWFRKKQIPYQFHNFKTEGIEAEKLLAWINKAGIEVVVNKRSTTWRNLTPETQLKLMQAESAVGVMISETSIIKRPVIENGTKLVIGYSEAEYHSKFGN